MDEDSERTWTDVEPEIEGEFPWRPVLGWGPRMLGAVAPPWEWSDVSVHGDRIYLLGRGEPATVVVVNPDGDLLEWWAWGLDEDPLRLKRPLRTPEREQIEAQRREIEREKERTRDPVRLSELDEDLEDLREREENPLSSRPHGITVAPDGRVAIVDAERHVVRLFTPQGELQRTIGRLDEPADTGVETEDHPVPGWTATVKRAGRPFNRPTKAAFAADGSLYVSDGYGNARIHHFGMAGERLRSWGEPGIEPGQFKLPHSVLVRRDGDVLVADREADRLQLFDPAGRWIRSFESVRRPTGIAELPDGRIVVAEMPWKRWEPTPRRGAESEGTPARITLLDPEGEVIGRYGNPRIKRKHDTRPGLLCAPHGVAVDARGDLYVTEVSSSLQGRRQPFTVQKFALVG